MDHPAAETIPVTQFRPRRDGPEAFIQDVVARQIGLFCQSQYSWTALSVPIGAGIPDLIFVSYDPQVFALTNTELTDAQILAYLRVAGKARLETIAVRIGKSPRKLSDRLSCLEEAAVVERSANSFFLTPPWRQILSEIVTVEVKVSNWQRAIEQAARNRIFAHLSFVAVPEKLAQRVKTKPSLPDLGIGLISVSEDGEVAIVGKPRRVRPIVWTYYYQLAFLLARSRPN